MDAEVMPVGALPPLEGYEVFECIGVGGLGAVYRARQRSTGVEVAIKMVRSVGDDSSAWRRTERELRALAGLRGHAHVVGVLEVVPTDNYRALVVDYAPGGSINNLVSGSGPLDVAQIVFVGRQVADALESAHERGIVHRDIKPHNLLIDGFGQVLVCDFGVASLLSEEEFRDRTSGLSVRYASPEDVEDEPDVLGPPSDVYSLGATLMFLRRGTPPTIIERVSGWVPPTTVGDEIATQLDALIADCLKLDPLERPTARTVHDRLRELEVQLPRPVAALNVADEHHPDDSIGPEPVTASADGDDTFCPPAQPPTETEEADVGAEAAEMDDRAAHYLVALEGLDSTDDREMRAEFRAALRPVPQPRDTDLGEESSGRSPHRSPTTPTDDEFWGVASHHGVRRPTIERPTAISKAVAVAGALAAVVVVAWMLMGRGESDKPTVTAPVAGPSVAGPSLAAPSVVGTLAAGTAVADEAVDIVERPNGLDDLRTVVWPFAERGTCVVQQPGRDELESISCDESHDLQSLGSQAITEAPDQLDDREIRDLAVGVCERMADDIASFDSGDQITVEATVPSATSWAGGDRVVQCWLRSPNRRMVGDALA